MSFVTYRIGLIHGHQIVPWGDHLALGMIRRKLNVDILVSGHTHQNEVVEHEGFYHINPVSLSFHILERATPRTHETSFWRCNVFSTYRCLCMSLSHTHTNTHTLYYMDRVL